MAAELKPTCVLLLPRPIQSFILADQARELASHPNVVALDPPSPGYGGALRLGDQATRLLASRQAASLSKKLRSLGAEPRVIVIFHATQIPVALALKGSDDCQIWYWRWDRYEMAQDATPSQRGRLQHLHALAMQSSQVVVASSVRLAELAQDELAQLSEPPSRGAEVILSPLSADDFPAPEPTASIVGFSLGHLGRRIDWTLLRGLGERLPELQLLLIGTVHEAECESDPDFQWCRSHQPFVFLGSQPDAVAAQLLRLSDVAILPFAIDEFNDSALPYRILKAARLGRKTITPDLAGCRTWPEAVEIAPDVDQFAALLKGASGRRNAPDAKLAEWALSQTAAHQNAQLHSRLSELDGE